MAAAKTKEQYVKEWKIHLHEFYTLANDVIQSDTNLAMKITDDMLSMRRSITKVGDILEREGYFSE